MNYTHKVKGFINDIFSAIFIIIISIVVGFILFFGINALIKSNIGKTKEITYNISTVEHKQKDNSGECYLYTYNTEKELIRIKVLDSIYKETSIGDSISYEQIKYFKFNEETKEKELIKVKYNY